MNKEGFLVVLKSQPPTETLYNSRYKGIDRIPPFSLEKYENGFDDPYLFGKYINSEGLIQDIELAKEALVDYSQIESVENLELIYVQEWKEDQPETKSNFHLLGFDVATDRPYWSIVNDSPSPTDSNFKELLTNLNEYGLFNTPQLARDYLKTYLLHIHNNHSKGLKVWEIFDGE